MKPSPRTAMPSAVDPAPLAGVAEEPPVEAERDAAPLAAEPKPLCRSPTALRAEGTAAAALALLGATELAKTGWPPLLVTPAVAPSARAANKSAGAPAPAPAEGETSPVAPLPLPPVAPLSPRLPPTAPLAPPLAEPSTGAGALAPPSAGAGAGAGSGAGGTRAGAGVEGGGPPEGVPAVGGAVPAVGGVPKPLGEQAQARLAPVTVAANSASTENERRRVRLCMGTADPLTSLELVVSCHLVRRAAA